MCPNEEQLEEYFAGLSSGDHSGGLEAHVESCDRCRSWLNEAREDEALLGGLRGVIADLPLSDCATVNRAFQPIAAPTNSPDSLSDTLSGGVAGFRILHQIGAGGMGCIYEGEQLEPRRRVAIKMVRDGRLAVGSRLKLFEREIEALGRLKHGSIAAIYASGVTQDQVPFFAMELVTGSSLMNFVRDRKLSTSERLGLFCRICDAVIYAHQRGVIHRDLKPSNILVEHDCTPKVLDFGLARIADGDSGPVTLEADVGRIRGTLPYMSPEQALGMADQIDTRTDVYSLGVILCELLTEQLPLELNGRSLPDAVRIICEQRPQNPSLRKHSLRGDLDTIILKALEKEPARRYESVTALRSDVALFLEDRPILATPPTLWYQARKFSARHRLAVSLFTIIAMLVIAFGIVANVEAVRFARERDKAISVGKFLEGMLAWFDPSNARGPEVTLRDVLGQAAHRVETELKDQPEVAATLHQTIGNGYFSLGVYDLAEKQLRRSLELRTKLLGLRNSARAETMIDLARVHKATRHFADAEPLYAEALDIQRENWGPDSAAVAEAINNYAALKYSQRQFDDAEQLFKQAIEIHHRIPGADESNLASGLSNLGMIMLARGKYDEGEPLLREALAIRRRRFGDADPLTAQFLLNWAGMLIHQHRNADTAEPLMREALGIQRRLYGDDHPDIVNTLENLSQTLQMSGKAEEAAKCSEEAKSIQTRLAGSSKPK